MEVLHFTTSQRFAKNGMSMFLNPGSWLILAISILKNSFREYDSWVWNRQKYSQINCIEKRNLYNTFGDSFLPFWHYHFWAETSCKSWNYSINDVTQNWAFFDPPPPCHTWTQPCTPTLKLMLQICQPPTGPDTKYVFVTKMLTPSPLSAWHHLWMTPNTS